VNKYGLGNLEISSEEKYDANTDEKLGYKGYENKKDTISRITIGE